MTAAACVYTRPPDTGRGVDGEARDGEGGKGRWGRMQGKIWGKMGETAF